MRAKINFSCDLIKTINILYYELIIVLLLVILSALLFEQIDENALHLSISIRYLTPVFSSRWSDPHPPIQVYDPLTSVAMKPIAWSFIEDLSSIGIVEIPKPVRQGSTAFLPAGPTLEGVVSLSNAQ